MCGCRCWCRCRFVCMCLLGAQVLMRCTFPSDVLMFEGPVVSFVVHDTVKSLCCSHGKSCTRAPLEATPPKLRLQAAIQQDHITSIHSQQVRTVLQANLHLLWEPLWRRLHRCAVNSSPSSIGITLRRTSSPDLLGRMVRTESGRPLRTQPHPHPRRRKSRR